MNVRRNDRAVIAVSLSTLLLLTCSPFCSAATLRIAGPDVSWHDLLIITNSVQCATDFSPDGSLVSTSIVDSCCALIPEWSAWHGVSDGVLDVWMDVVANGSNHVTVLLGSEVAPAITLSRGDEWTVLPGGQFPVNAVSPVSTAPTTNRIHLLLRTMNVPGGGRAMIRTQAGDANWQEYEELTLRDLNWMDPRQYPSGWSRIGVCLAGPQAQLLSLTLRWHPDGTLMIFR